MQYYRRGHIIITSSCENFFQWLSDNQMKCNAEKCHLIMSANESVDFHLRSSLIKSSDCEKMSVVNIDYKLNFDKYVKTLFS